jgi:hypothetical protein
MSQEPTEIPPDLQLTEETDAVQCSFTYQGATYKCRAETKNIAAARTECEKWAVGMYEYAKKLEARRKAQVERAAQMLRKVRSACFTVAEAHLNASVEKRKFLKPFHEMCNALYEMTMTCASHTIDAEQAALSYELVEHWANLAEQFAQISENLACRVSKGIVV